MNARREFGRMRFPGLPRSVAPRLGKAAALFLLAGSTASAQNSVNPFPVVSESQSGGSAQGAVNASVGNVAGNTLTVTQSGNRAVVDWETFDIAEGNTVVFDQSNANWSILNRVITPGDRSDIFGNIQAQGMVIIANPAGIYFGPNSVINVGGLVAGAAQIQGDLEYTGMGMNQEAVVPDGTATAMFTQSGQLNFTIDPALANQDEDPDVAMNDPAVINDGAITANGDNPLVYLLGARVRNSGTITLEGTGGVMTFFSGAGVSMIPADPDNRVSVVVNLTNADQLNTTPEGANTAGVRNVATIKPGDEGATGGNVNAQGSTIFLGASDLYSLAIAHDSGTLNAGPNGSVELLAGFDGNGAFIDDAPGTDNRGDVSIAGAFVTPDLEVLSSGDIDVLANIQSTGTLLLQAGISDTGDVAPGGLSTLNILANVASGESLTLASAGTLDLTQGGNKTLTGDAISLTAGTGETDPVNGSTVEIDNTVSFQTFVSDVLTFELRQDADIQIGLEPALVPLNPLAPINFGDLVLNGANVSLESLNGSLAINDWLPFENANLSLSAARNVEIQSGMPLLNNLLLPWNLASLSVHAGKSGFFINGANQLDAGDILFGSTILNADIDLRAPVMALRSGNGLTGSAGSSIYTLNGINVDLRADSGGGRLDFLTWQTDASNLGVAGPSPEAQFNTVGPLTDLLGPLYALNTNILSTAGSLRFDVATLGNIDNTNVTINLRARRDSTGFQSNFGLTPTANEFFVSANDAFDGAGDMVLGLDPDLPDLPFAGEIFMDVNALSTLGEARFLAPVTLQRTLFLLGAGDKTFESTVDSTLAFDASINSFVRNGLSVSSNGAISFDGQIGARSISGDQFLSSLSFLQTTGAATATFNADRVVTEGFQSFFTPIAITQAGTEIRSVSGTLSFASTVTGSGGGGLSAIALGNKNFNGTVTGLATLTTDGAGVTNLNTASLNNIGDVMFNNDVVLSTNVTIQSDNLTFGQSISSNVDGQNALTATVTGATLFLGDVGFDANANQARLLALDVTSDGGIQIGDDDFMVTPDLIRFNTLEGQRFASSVNFGASAEFTAGNAFVTLLEGIAFESGAAALTGTAYDVTLTSAADKLIVGDVGSDAMRLASFRSLGSGVTFFGANANGGSGSQSLFTGGSQRYESDVVLGRDTTLVSGEVIAFDGRIGSFVDGGLSPFRLETDAGDATNFTQSVGAIFAANATNTGALRSLSVTGEASLGDDDGVTPFIVTTLASQDWNDTVFLRESVQIEAGNGLLGIGDVLFAGTVSGTGEMVPDSLFVDANGDTRFAGNVFDIDTLETVGGGRTIFGNNTGAITVTTTGDQLFREGVILDADATLNAGLLANEILFETTLGSSTNGSFGLTAGAGVVSFEGDVGAALDAMMMQTDAPLAFLHVTNSAGTARFGTDQIGEVRSVLTDQGQRFEGLVDLRASTTFEGGADSGSGFSGLQFDDSIIPNIDDTYSLTVDTAETTSFFGDIGTIGNALTTVNILGGGDVLFGDAGIFALRGTPPQRIVVTGDLSFANDIILRRDLEVIAGSATYQGEVTSLDTGPYSLTTTADAGDVVFQDEVGRAFASQFGQTGPLAFLRSNGDAIRLGTGPAIDIRTVGDQEYLAPVVVAGDTAMFGATIDFSDDVDAGGAGVDLDVTATTQALFNNVGSNVELESLDVFGPARFFGVSVRTNGAQNYDGAVIVQDDATFEGDSISFLSTLDGDAPSSNLSFLVDSSLMFGGEVGGITPLSSLTVLASVTPNNPTAMLSGGLIATTGVQDYAIAANLGADQILQGQTIRFGSTLDGAFGLTSIASTTLFDGVVGGTAALASLEVTGDTDVLGGAIATSGAQNFMGNLRLGADTTFTTQTMRVTGTTDAALAGDQWLLDVDATGLAEYLGSVGAGGGIRVADVNAGSISFGDALTVVTDALLTSTSSVFVGGAANGGGRMVVTAPGTVEFAGLFGNSSPFTELDANTGSITFQQAVVFGSTAAITSSGNIDFNGPVNGSTTLTASATNGQIRFGDAVGAANALNTLTLTGDTVLFEGDLFASNTATVNASDEARFDGQVNGAMDLLVDSAGEIRFNAEIGNQTALSSMSLTGDGRAIMAGGSAVTTGDQSYAIATFIENDTELTAQNLLFSSTVDSLNGIFDLTTNAGGNTEFQGRVAGDSVMGDLVVNAEGDTTFASGVGEIGGQGGLGSLTTDEAGRTILTGAGIRTSGGVLFGDAVVVNSDTSVTGDNVRFGSTLTTESAGPVALGVTANGTEDPTGDASFDGAISGPLALSVVAEDTALFGDTIGVGGDLASLDVEAGQVLFRGDLDGAMALSVRGTNLIRFDGDLGRENPLASISLVFGEVVATGPAGPEEINFGRLEFRQRPDDEIGATGDDFFFDPNVQIFVRSTGTISINDFQLDPNNPDLIPRTAIIGADADLMFESLADDVRLGQNQKLTVLGDLAICAQDEVTLSDVNALGDILVKAGQITLLRRDSGQIFRANETFATDEGLDILANGSITFEVPSSRRIVVGGRDRGAVVIASHINDISNNILGANNVTAGTFPIEITPELLAVTTSDNVGPLEVTQFLDLSPGALGADIIAGVSGLQPTETELPDVDQDLAVPAAELDALARRLFIRARTLSDFEVGELLAGRTLLLDPPESIVMPALADESEVVRERMGYGAIQDALATYASFTQDREPLEIQEGIRSAWEAYEARDESEFTREDLQAFLDQPEFASVREDIEGLRRVFRTYGAIGTTDAEIRRSKDGLLDSIRPRTMDAGLMRELVEAPEPDVQPEVEPGVQPEDIPTTLE